MKSALASILSVLQVAVLSGGLPASAAANSPQDMSVSVDAKVMARAFAAGGVKAADAANVQVMQAREVAAKSLGEDARDLVFVPITPCTVWDTRFAASAPFMGAIGSGATRQFYSHLDAAGGNFTAYGGNPSCTEANQTFLGGRPFAAMMIVYVNNPVGSGWLTFYRDGDPDPSNATISVYYSPGPTRTQTVISKSSRGYGSGTYDIAVTGRFSTADASASVVGYFLKPVNITLPNSTATSGNLLKGGTRFIHNYGSGNTFVGESAGNFTMTGSSNTVVGQGALFSNTSGNVNTASGAYVLYNNTEGAANTGSGSQALFSNTTGSSNIANGGQALFNNTTGNANTASGRYALVSNTTGSDNTASGYSSLYNNTTGNANAALGVDSLHSNTTGIFNAASGHSALYYNTTGYYNTAIGAVALYYNTTGGSNIAIGHLAGLNLTTGNSNIMIGNQGGTAESNTIRIGTNGSHISTFLAGIRGVTTINSNAIAVLVDSAGQLGTVSSSRRVKDDIADMDRASAALMKLRPVTFYYKTDRNPSGRTLQYGLVAEEVAEVYPGLVAHSEDGQIETVMYQFLTPMLLNEVQKQQRTIMTQAKTVAELERDRKVQVSRIGELERDRKSQMARIAALEKETARIADLEKQTARMAAALDGLQRAGTVTAGLGLN